MLGAADSISGDASHALAPRLRNSVMAIDEVIATGCDLGEDHRARHVRFDDHRFI
jgi:hypothetical protein